MKPFLGNLSFKKSRNAEKSFAFNSASSALPPLEKKQLENNLKEALSNKNWNCSNTTLVNIARASTGPSIQITLKHINDALNSKPNKWKLIFKGLILIEFLLKFGDHEVIKACGPFDYKLRQLSEFYIQEGGQERGTGIRDKAKYIISLLTDQEFLATERTAAQDSRNKVMGGQSQPIQATPPITTITSNNQKKTFNNNVEAEREAELAAAMNLERIAQSNRTEREFEKAKKRRERQERKLEKERELQRKTKQQTKSSKKSDRSETESSYSSEGYEEESNVKRENSFLYNSNDKIYDSTNGVDTNYISKSMYTSGVSTGQMSTNQQTNMFNSGVNTAQQSSGQTGMTAQYGMQNQYGVSSNISNQYGVVTAGNGNTVGGQYVQTSAYNTSNSGQQNTYMKANYNNAQTPPSQQASSPYTHTQPPPYLQQAAHTQPQTHTQPHLLTQQQQHLTPQQQLTQQPLTQQQHLTPQQQLTQQQQFTPQQHINHPNSPYSMLPQNTSQANFLAQTNKLGPPSNLGPANHMGITGTMGVANNMGYPGQMNVNNQNQSVGGNINQIRNMANLNALNNLNKLNTMNQTLRHNTQQQLPHTANNPPYNYNMGMQSNMGMQQNAQYNPNNISQQYNPYLNKPNINPNTQQTQYTLYDLQNSRPSNPPTVNRY